MLEVSVLVAIFICGLLLGALLTRSEPRGNSRNLDEYLHLGPDGTGYVQLPTSRKPPPTPASMYGIRRIGPDGKAAE